jgi:hypothetical protein
MPTRLVLTPIIGLEDYCYCSLKSSVSSHSNISTKEKKALESTIDKTIGWLDSNHSAPKEMYEKKEKLLERTTMPILGHKLDGSLRS